MQFLEKTEFESLIKAYDLEQLTAGEDSLLDLSELAAIHEMQSYLIDRYDVAAIFEVEEDEDKHPLIKMYLIDMVLYHLHSRLARRDMPLHRENRYNIALQWLRSVAEGELNPNLPIRKDDEDKDIMNFRMGSNPRFKSDY